MTQYNDATKAQVRAARPDASTWLAANAGSGKTRVLTDRVARLLLDGVQPQHILCLTYTKAAASEMQNRLFKRLGEWAMKGDESLRASLLELGVTGEVTEKRLRDARTLFARAIETPGGLKIQTIHSFCAALLRRFPLEAKVSPQFTEIEDRAADLLRAEIVDQMADSDDAPFVRGIAIHNTDQDFATLTKDIVKHREGFANPLNWSEALALFEQPETLTEDSIAAQVFLGDEQQIIDTIVPPMLAKGGNDEKAANVLRNLAAVGFAALPVLESVFLTGPKTKTPFSAKLGSFPTKPTQALLSDVMPALNDFMFRVEGAHKARLALMAAKKTYALHQFGHRFIARYEEQKLLRGWLDFDDLIDKARLLLSDKDVAAWVLFRIDGGIDHILVDEAQDTSPAQWDVIAKLSAEFSSGQGAREDVDRTIFVVGDKKQSIYSFQGADPREFDRMRFEFREKFEAVEKRFQSETLRYSFRSSAAVLKVVDETFAGQDEAGFTKDASHIAFKSALPGRVDLWPVVPSQKSDDERKWFEPLDRKSQTHHSVLLADRIAGQIKEMVQGGQTIPDEDPETRQPFRRPVRYGDFLILVQSRTSNAQLFSEIIRACKTHQLPIAGADRLKVGGELAVQDLAALLAFLAVPDDSLSLAAALKSPLFGWSEQDLFTLAHGRGEIPLWQALRSTADDYPQTMAMINDLRDQTDFLRPYDLIERILTRHKGRRKLLSRLGPEAEDGIDALLSQALAYERNAVPSLTGFLVWMETDDLEIKRQIDSAFDQIRVMTVHGAKGLEAPIVILPDCGGRTLQIKDSILKIGDRPVWKTASADMPGTMSNVLNNMKDAQQNERLRLLYVALTRAEKWLIVATAGDLPTSGDSWYQRVEAAIDEAGAETVSFQGLEVKRHAHADWHALPMVETKDTASEEPHLEPFFYDAVRQPADPQPIISPSELGGDKALAGDGGRSEEHAKAYGRLVHRCLEVFSQTTEGDWHNIAASLPLDGCTELDRQEAIAEASTIIRSPDCAWIFGEGSLSEVPISAALGTHRMFGVIDRLIVDDNHVWAIDFKTNAVVPTQSGDCPSGILRQMGAYTHGLQQIYPQNEIKLGILWTRGARFMSLEHEIVTSALHDTLYLDAPSTAS